MWFIIRAAFCVGVVFSMTPGGQVIDEAGGTEAALSAFAAPAVRELANGALSTCKSDPKLCLEAAQRLAGLGSELLPRARKAGTPDGVRLVADTLTAADRGAPWRGKAKEPRGPTRLRLASHPSI
jgi:hypothetical protein